MKDKFKMIIISRKLRNNNKLISLMNNKKIYYRRKIKINNNFGKTI
jgi:hypothetical protein